MNNKIPCSIGILIHNEAANIANLLSAFQGQHLENVSVSEIIVVSSASTDGSDQIVEEYSKKCQSVRLIREEERRGKSAAINIFLQAASENIVIISSGDIIPESSTVEMMINPFRDNTIGMTGCHPLPTNKTDSLTGKIVNFQWRLHHKVALQAPKLGEMVAFRKIMISIPEDSAVDEASIEAAIVSQGLSLCYIPEAIVLNHGPESITGFVQQRRRIAAGHLWLKKKEQYRVSTNNPKLLLRIILTEIIRKPLSTHIVLITFFLEFSARILGWYDLVIKKSNPFKWDVIPSTKRIDC